MEDVECQVLLTGVHSVTEESPVEGFTEEEQCDTQQAPRREWLKYGKGLLLATLVLCAVVAGGAFNTATTRTSAHAAYVGLTAQDIGAMLSTATVGKPWNDAISTFNDIVAATYTGTDPTVLEIRTIINTEGNEERRHGLLLAMSNACESHPGPSSCDQINAALSAANSESASVSSGDAESSSGDAQTSSGDAQTSSGDAQTSSGDAQTSSGDAQTSSGDAQTSSGDALPGDGEDCEDATGCQQPFMCNEGTCGPV